MSTRDAVAIGARPRERSSATRRTPRWRSALRPYAFLLPAVALFTVFVYAPAMLNVGLASVDWSPLHPDFAYVGGENFERVLQAPPFRQAASNTFAYGLVTVPLSIALGLGVALLINSLRRGRGFWRAIYFLPVASMVVAMAIVWQFILDSRVGLANEVMKLLGREPQGWLVESRTALWSIIGFGTWRLVGYMMVLYLAGLSSIPTSVLEAASLDGLRGWSRFRHVLWPLLAPTTLFAAVIGTILAVELFDPVKIMTNGGPADATTTLALLIWKEGFSYFSFGRAAVVSLIVFGLSLLLTALQMLIFNRNIYYEA